MRSALDDKLAGLSRDSRYAYLLNQGWVTKDDIADAEKQAGTARSSVDAVLMDAFSISKDDIGRSLSLYYDVPFKTYDPNAMAPVELMARLAPRVSGKEGWVPIAAYENEVEVLMEHPDDAEMVQRARELLNAGSLNLSVGVREDIGLYLERFLP